MKKIFSAFILSFFLNSSYAQPGEWVWIHGANTVNSAGSFGVQGVSSPTNEPPAFYEACEWTDLNGNFWLFGGLPSGFSAYGDLWKYDPVTNEWTWMKGSGLAGNTGNFGIQGVSSPANQPPAREHGALTWTDLSNNLWMYGGNSVLGDLSDLWKYDIATNEWTWMKGPSTAYDPGTYGTMGVSAPANNPSSREEAASAWTDNNGDLWFFGGWIGAGAVNDLWKYNIATNEWAWMKGSAFISQPGVYGTYRVEDPANVPGSRCAYTHWKDNSGNFWLFGGEDFSANDFNDMWRFNPSTNNWAWMKGSNVQGASPVYGTKCVTDSLNDPGTRYENRVVWVDVNGNLWTFGGNVGYLTTDYKNDLWMYCIATNEWTWINGDNIPNPPGSWGTLGFASPLNKPDGRMGCVGWRSLTGELYVFGGTTLSFGSFHNDLWKYTIDPACAFCNTMPVALFNAPNHICPGTCTDFSNISLNATSFQWIFAGASPGTSTDINPAGICYNTPGTYGVTLIAYNVNGSDTLVLNNFITVYPYPAPQGILQVGDTLFANAGAVSYQWYQGGNLIPGATNYFYVAAMSGNYNVVATDANGCEVEAAIFDVIALVQSQDLDGIEVFPNPVSEKLEVRIPVSAGREFSEKSAEIFIYNIIGKKIITMPLTAMNFPLLTQLDVHALAQGVYWLEVTDGKHSFRNKFIKH
jgi:hypothetical protein